MGIIYGEWLSKRQTRKKRSHEYYIKVLNELIFLKNVSEKDIDNIRFLDFGMGWSEWCIAAKSIGMNSYGTDISKEKLRYAEKNGVSIFNEFEIHNNKFDIINAEQVFEHIPNPLEQLKYFKNFLNINGIIRITVPNGTRIKNKLTDKKWDKSKHDIRSINSASPLEHINTYNYKSLDYLGHSLGLKIKEIPIYKQYNIRSKGIKAKTYLKDITRPIIRKFRLNLSNELYMLYQLEN